MLGAFLSLLGLALTTAVFSPGWVLEPFTVGFAVVIRPLATFAQTHPLSFQLGLGTVFLVLAALVAFGLYRR